VPPARTVPVLAAAAAILGIAAAAWLYGHCHFERARATAEQQLGSFDLASMRHGEIEQWLDRPNAEYTFFDAGSKVQLTPVEARFLARLATDRRWQDRSAVQASERELLARNAEALSIAYGALDQPWCDALIEYEKVVPPIPDWTPQIRLARLLLAEGTIAVAEGSAADALRDVALLGRHAACLENEEEPSALFAGITVERLQHRLIALAVERLRLSAGYLDSLLELLPRIDVARTYRRGLRLHAARIAANHRVRATLPRAWLRRAILRLVTSHQEARAIERDLLLRRASFWPAPRVARELDAGPPDRFDCLWPALLPDNLLELLNLRAIQSGRGSARLALAARRAMLAGSDCATAWTGIESQQRQPPAAQEPETVQLRLRVSARGCTLVDAESQAYYPLGASGSLLAWRLPAR
jgi:hypothetical protein